MLNQVQHDNILLATFTGKPVGSGGTLGRTEATGRGGVMILKSLLLRLNDVRHHVFESGSPQRGPNRLTQKKASSLFNSLTIAVQGFGNVGYYFAKIAQEEGFKVVAVSDSKGGIIKQNPKSKTLNPKQILNHKTKDSFLSLDIPLIMKCKKERGSLAGCYCSGGVCDAQGGKFITNEELLGLPVDILVPAALENVINEDNMRSIKAKIIIEMANGPITEEAYEYLSKRGVIIVPDVLSNSGGVTVSYLEWYQNIHNVSWSEKKVNKKLEQMMADAFKDIWKISRTSNVPLKQAAFEVAIGRIEAGMRKMV